jgi:hypothetical protein
MHETIRMPHHQVGFFTGWQPAAQSLAKGKKERNSGGSINYTVREQVKVNHTGAELQC